VRVTIKQRDLTEKDTTPYILIRILVGFIPSRFLGHSCCEVAGGGSGAAQMRNASIERAERAGVMRFFGEAGRAGMQLHCEVKSKAHVTHQMFSSIPLGLSHILVPLGDT
jgi:hypothetical protein